MWFRVVGTLVSLLSFAEGDTNPNLDVRSLGDFCYPDGPPGTATHRMQQSIRIVTTDWLSHNVVTYIVGILLREVLRYDVQIVRVPAHSGHVWRDEWLDLIADGHVDVDIENWWTFQPGGKNAPLTETVLPYVEGETPLLAKPLPVGYSGRSGLYLLKGAQDRHGGAPDFYRHYGPRGDKLGNYSHPDHGILEEAAALNASGGCGDGACRVGGPEGYWVPNSCHVFGPQCAEVLMGPEEWDRGFFERLVLTHRLRMVFKYHSGKRLDAIRRELVPSSPESVFYSFYPNWGAEDQGSVRISFPDTNCNVPGRCGYAELILAKVVAWRLKSYAPEAFFMLQSFEIDRDALLYELIQDMPQDISEDSLQATACSFLLRHHDIQNRLVPACAVRPVLAPKPADLIFDPLTGACRPAPTPHTFRCFADHERPTNITRSEVIAIGAKTWLSHRILEFMVAIMLREYLGYSVIFQPLDSFEPNDWSFMQKPEVADMDPERWFAHDPSTIKKWVDEEEVVVPMPLGISGRSGLYVLPHSLQTHLFADYYSFYTGSHARRAGFQPPNQTDWAIFSGGKSECLSEPERYPWCGGPVPRVGFYTTPACEQRPEDCAEVIMSTPYYDKGFFEQLAGNMNLTVAMGYYGVDWTDTVLRRADAGKHTIFYAWTPHPLLAKIKSAQSHDHGRISFPDTYYGCVEQREPSPEGPATCDFPEEPIVKLMAARLWQRAPEAAYMFTQFFVNEQHVNELFRLHREGGGALDDVNTACAFVRNNEELVRSFAPDCISRPLSPSDMRNGSVVFIERERRCRPIACKPNEHLVTLEEPVCTPCSTSSQLMVPSEDGLHCRSCPAGYAADAAGAQCVVCPSGSFSDPEAGVVLCESCPVGFYNPLPAQKRCSICPKGASCPNKGTRVFVASPGFFIIGAAEAVVEQFRLKVTSSDSALDDSAFPGVGPIRCPVPTSCLGNNTCFTLEGKASMDGPLCASCLPGYQRSTPWQLCGKCPSRSSNIAVIVVVLFLYGLGICLWARLNVVSLESSLTAVVGKILYNFLVMVSCVSDIIQADAVLTKVSQMSLMPQGISSLVSAALGVGAVAESPSDSVLSYDCLVQGSGFKPDHLKILMAWLVVPAVMLTLFALTLAEWIIRITFVVARESLSCKRVGTPSVQARSNTGELQDDMSAHSSRKELGCACLSSFAPRMVVALYILHPMVTSVFFSAFECGMADEETGVRYDTMRLLSRMQIDCQSSMHERWQILAGLGIVVWSCGIPAFLWFKLWWNRYALHSTSILRAYGFLYQGFQHRYYYQELTFMVKKTFVKFVAICPWLDINTRTVFLVVLSVLFLSWHLAANPYQKVAYFALDRLELWSNITFFLLLLGRDVELVLRTHEPEAKGSAWAYIPGICCLCWLLARSVYLVVRPEIWPMFERSVLPHWLVAMLRPLRFDWGLSPDDEGEREVQLGRHEYLSLSTTPQVNHQHPRRQRMMSNAELAMLKALCVEATELLVRRHELLLDESLTQLCMPTFIINLERLLLGCMMQAMRMKVARAKQRSERATLSKWAAALVQDAKQGLKTFVRHDAQTVERQWSSTTGRTSGVGDMSLVSEPVSVEELYAALVKLSPHLLERDSNLHHNRLKTLCQRCAFMPFDVSPLFHHEAHARRIEAWINPPELTMDRRLSERSKASAQQSLTIVLEDYDDDDPDPQDLVNPSLGASNFAASVHDVTIQGPDPDVQEVGGTKYQL